MSPSRPSFSGSTRLRCVIVIGTAIGLSLLFFWELWIGGGLVGGDIFPYFLPQKAFYAAELNEGRLPLWNPLTGHGYPVLGESQTAALYPPNLLAYRFLSLNAAYNAVQILHYILAFVFTWLYARRIGLYTTTAIITASAFVYGWFPARISLEWAVVTGCWFPAALWRCECLLASRRLRDACWLAIVLGLQLLAGHYHLAFISQLTILGYAVFRVLLSQRTTLHASASGRITRTQCISQIVLVCLGIACGFAVAAVQLMPSWELKDRSQRQVASREHAPGYGSIPPDYLRQLVTPWVTYRDRIDLNMDAPADRPMTNQVEAHLYVGLAPLLLVLIGIFHADVRRVPHVIVWLMLIAFSLAYAVGWLVPYLEWLPGFSYFRGAGRFGMISALGLSTLAGISLQNITKHWRPFRQTMLIGLVLICVVVDLRIVSPLVRDAHPTPQSILDYRQETLIAPYLHKQEKWPRVYAPYPNVWNLTGLSAVPVYLGLGPEEYFQEAIEMPQDTNSSVLGEDTRSQIEPQVTWLRKAGVTHLISEQRLGREWPVDELAGVIDPFMHRIFSRSSQQPFWLYRLRESRGRIAWENSRGTADITIRESLPTHWHIEVDANASGQLVLTELLYPGWQVFIDGKNAEPTRVEGMFRGVQVPEGQHHIVWTYRPRSVFFGAIVSISTLLVMSVFVLKQSLSRRRENERDHDRLRMKTTSSAEPSSSIGWPRS